MATPELYCLITAAGLGLAQSVLRGDLGRQVRRNYAETFPLFALLVGVVLAQGSGGEMSANGALLYVTGRVLYLLLSVRPLRSVRKFAWALSVAGLIGLAAEVVVRAAERF